MFLPKYSPDLNLIEQVFAKFKTLLRGANLRSYPDPCSKILAQYPPPNAPHTSKRRICVDPKAGRSKDGAGEASANCSVLWRPQDRDVTEQDCLDIVKRPRAEAERPEGQSRRSLWAWKTNLFVAELRRDSRSRRRFSVGHNGPAFQVFVEQSPVPELGRRLGHHG
jgi:hypothetical protein